MTGSRFSQGFVDLTAELGVLKVHGKDAASFLQAQFTNDVQSLTADGFRLAGYCTPKGRLIASFWIWRDPAMDEQPDTFWLLLSRGLAAAIAKRLTMFVLRAKVKVENLSESATVLGRITAEPQHAGTATPAALAAPDPALRFRPLSPVTVGETAASLLPELSVAAGASLRRDIAWLVEGSVTLPQPALATSVWQRLEVLSGVARITPENQELFVPQMINFERVDGVSFRKGCYPGQEVVARSQYLGKLKRRAFLGRGEGPVPTGGTDVAATEAAAEPIGQVVNAAPLADGTSFVALFESRVDAVGEGAAAVRIDGRPVDLLPLPYPLVDEPATAAR